MAKLILFGSEGSAGSLIRQWVPAKTVTVDKDGGPTYTLDYLKPAFEEATIRILEAERPSIAVIASGLNPVDKVSALAIDNFSIDNGIINFFAPFHICKQCVRYGVEKIVVFTSAAGVTAPTGCAEYSAWKAALNASILSMATEVGDEHAISLYSPGSKLSNANLQEDLKVILESEEGGFFYVRFETNFIKLPIGKLCYKVGFKTDKSSSEQTLLSL